MNKHGGEVIKLRGDGVSNDGDSSCTGSDILIFFKDGCAILAEDTAK